jgi:DNA-directed RNA polymerase subunit RPC12/RpoP
MHRRVAPGALPLAWHSAAWLLALTLAACTEPANAGDRGPALQEFLLPAVIVAVVVIWRIAMAVTAGRRGEAAPGSYGPAGGAVCPACGRAFARGALSPNLIAGKLCRCPHCGAWRIVPRAGAAALAAAEAAHAPVGAAGAPPTAPSGEEALRRRIDESRYESSDSATSDRSRS